MFCVDSFSGNHAVFSFFFFGKRCIFFFFFRQNGIGMYHCNASIACIRFKFCILSGMNTGFFEQPEIVLFPIAEAQADDFHCFLINDKLGFQCMPFLFSGIVSPLFFWGRSIGVSVASIRIISYSASLFSNSFLPGKEKVPSFIRTFSIHLMLR